MKRPITMNKTKILAFIGYFILFVTAFISEFLKLQILKFRPLNHYDLFMFVWLLIPYLIMGYMLNRHLESGDKLKEDIRTTFIVSSVGLFLSAAILYVQPSSLAERLLFPLVPVVQLIIFGILSFI